MGRTAGALLIVAGLVLIAASLDPAPPPHPLERTLLMSVRWLGGLVLLGAGAITAAIGCIRADLRVRDERNEKRVKERQAEPQERRDERR